MKKIVTVLLITLFVITGCNTTETKEDIANTQALGDSLSKNQPTPTDINYSLERYNLIKRAYWVNGERERAISLMPEVQLPLGYIVLFSANSVVSQFTVEGKVSSLNSFLTPSNLDEYYGSGGVLTYELPDVDGSYGENDNGIFFFTVDGKYVEWTGDYIYSDIPLFIDNPTVQLGE